MNYVDDLSDMMRDPSNIDTRPPLPKTLPPGTHTSSSYRADQINNNNGRNLNENSSLSQNKIHNNFNFSDSNPSLNNRMQLPILDINQTSPPTPLKRINQPSISSQNNITLSSTSLSNRTPAPPPYKTINDITPSAHEFLNAKNTNQNSTRINGSMSYNNNNLNNSNSNLYSTVFKNNGGSSNNILNMGSGQQQQLSSHSNVESRRNDAAAPDANLSKLNVQSNLGTLAGGIKVLPTGPITNLNKDECNLLLF